MQHRMFCSSLMKCSRNVLLLGGIAATLKTHKKIILRVQQLQASHSLDHLAKQSLGLLPLLPIVSAADHQKYMAKPITSEEYLNSSDDIKAHMEKLILRIQREFCEALEAEETSEHKFIIDRWNRKNNEEGGGITCVLQNGAVFEKAGVNVTVMKAPLSQKLQETMRSRGKNLPQDCKFQFFAAGISSVIHPRNPYVPTMHFNFRYFEIQDQDGKNKHCWFGGGADLTPYYLNSEDNAIFHGALKKACDKHGLKRYPEYKKICDNYFYIKARGERRGIGGIFFDDLESDEPMKEFKFVRDCAEAIIPSYIPIIKLRKDMKYTRQERDWQLIRRGRYVEFNLVYDRGTKFGFATPGARMESVLVSLPLVAKWEYMHTPPKDSREYKLLEVLRDPKDWV